MAVRRRPRPGRGLSVFSCRAERLESRRLLAVFTVTSTADDGPGSLRQAIVEANAAPGFDEIRFDIPGPGVRTIAPRSPLPAALEPVRIDGTTQPGYAGTPLIEIDGSSAGPAADGLALRPGPQPPEPIQGAGILALVVNRFSGNGIVVAVQSNIYACKVGVNASGDAALPNGGAGVLVQASGPGNAVLLANVISGNRGSGVVLSTPPGGGSPPVAFLQGNFIGTGTSATRDVGNGGDGVTVAAGSATLTGNLVSGNDRDGVRSEPGGGVLRLEANKIGTNWAGNAALPNAGAGVRILGSGGSIGGPQLAQRNLISGNGGPGVYVGGGGAITPGSFSIQGNYIGTDAGGAIAIGNGAEGILVDGDPLSPVRDFAVGGGESLGQGNLISGNAASGVRMVNATEARVYGNRIGTDFSGTRPLPNGASAAAAYRDGVTWQAPPAGGNLNLGGVEAGQGNLISANAGAGIAAYGGSVDAGYNFIGTDVTGEIDLGNGGDGMHFAGAPARSYYSVISGNGGDGIHSDLGVLLDGNKIGTNSAGTRALGNDGDGVDMSARAWTDVVRNVISANHGHGIRFGGATSQFGLYMQRNHVGVDVTGTVALGNGGSGVYITSRSFNIGSEINGANVISANGGDGITVVGNQAYSLAYRAFISFNRIGTDAAGGDAGLGNRGHGISVIDAGVTYIGSDHWLTVNPDNRANTIAYNGGDGVHVAGTSRQVRVGFNRIFSNGGLEIDLGADGVTPNDPLDADAGPNGLLNFPVIQSAAAEPSATDPTRLPGSTAVRFTLDARPLSTYAVEFYAVRNPDPSGHGGSDRRLGFAEVTTDAAGHYAGAATVGQVFAGESVTATTTDTDVSTSEFAAAVRATVPEVAGRFVFYNQSRLDGNDPAPSPRDDAAIAFDKRALLPGGRSTFSNVTNYSRGINGVMIDVAPLPAGAVLTATDFDFRSGSGDPGAVWVDAPDPLSITVRRGAGVLGTDRVTLVWPESGPGAAVRDAWLQVTVRPTANTGLSRPDVFYFGNLAGEVTPADPGPWRVDANDFAAVRGHMGRPMTAAARAYDLNQDGVVNVRDLAVVLANYGRTLSPFDAAPASPATTALRRGRLLDEVLPATRRRPYESR
jgi:hypothetical protein